MIAHAGLLGGGWRELVFTAFREGVDICILHQGEEDSATVACCAIGPAPACRTSATADWKPSSSRW